MKLPIGLGKVYSYFGGGYIQPPKLQFEVDSELPPFYFSQVSLEASSGVAALLFKSEQNFFW